MNIIIFHQWLFRFNAAVSATRRTRMLLLLDNASAHGHVSSLPVLPHVNVYFLPKKTTAILQPMDARVIACVNKRYKRKLVEHAVDLLDSGVFENIYDTDLHRAITWIYDTWYLLGIETVRSV